MRADYLRTHYALWRLWAPRLLGTCWLACQLYEQLELDRFWSALLDSLPWPVQLHRIEPHLNVRNRRRMQELRDQRDVAGFLHQSSSPAAGRPTVN